MTSRASLATTTTSYGSAGWAAIASGAGGVVACGFLVTALRLRTAGDAQTAEFLFRGHDIGAILQYLCLIPVVCALQRFSQERSGGLGRPIITVGIAVLALTAALLLVEFFHLDWLPWYMVSQGVVGGWLIVASWRMAKILPWYLTGPGIIIGLGLVLVGTFPLGYTLLVDPSAAESVANDYLHQILKIGSYLGVFPLPVWTFLIGGRLLRVKNR